MPIPSSVLRVSPFLAVAIVAICCTSSVAVPVAISSEMVEGMIQGRRVEGVLVGVGRQPVELLGRDGRLWPLDRNQPVRFQKTASSFRPYPPSEFRAVLLRELGSDYEVTGTSHYLIAHPRGQRSRWDERLEDLYRSFVQYFSVRGFQPAPPPFPLVGIVCKNRGDFDRRAASGAANSPGVLGFYEPLSNRITLYDMGGGDATNWRHNASVLVHEATHQMAFNTGIHSRYAPTPTWVAEGLATLFEAPGVSDSHANTRLADRVNWGRLRAFRQVMAPHHRPEMLASIVASDDLFQANPTAAYAEAWALTFFLVETQPHDYARYLKRTGSRPPFQKYTAAERTADFTAVFGGNWQLIEARFLRFIAGVR